MWFDYFKRIKSFNFSLALTRKKGHKISPMISIYVGAFVGKNTFKTVS